MRVSTACKRLLRLPGAGVADVSFTNEGVVVTVGLRRRRRVCGSCDQIGALDIHDRRAALSQATNLSGLLGVIPADKHQPGKRNPMFRINLKSSIATVAVIAGVLAVAGPASASSTPLQNSMVSGVVQAPGGQGRVGQDVRGFVESQYVPTLAEAVIGMAPNGGLAHEREPSAASSAAQEDGSSNTLMVGLTDDHTNVLHAETWFGDTLPGGARSHHHHARLRREPPQSSRGRAGHAGVVKMGEDRGAV